ncbi:MULTISPECIES: glutathione S-transferase family protein [Psychromonas]|uniref:glutathione S-transferase family protein n=1 Tax=Psychromonas TaxID=67572 RepID=UPI0004295696|nr:MULTISPECIES: glutathione S-transferase family protein [Psychromonas]MBB1273035.1 glutathione S-transferase [Psychromonas sp. SR45-3]
MELYGSYTSPFVRHCRIAFLQTELDFKFIEIDATQSAELSPTKKVPLLIDCELQLTDSTSILTHIYEVAGEEFLNDVEEVELYHMANTLLDAYVNLFMLAKFDGITPEKSIYLTRQQQRIESGLVAINNKKFSQALPLTHAEVRLAAFVDWATYRELLSLNDYPHLQQLLTLANTDPIFVETAPKG